MISRARARGTWWMALGALVLAGCGAGDASESRAISTASSAASSAATSSSGAPLASGSASGPASADTTSSAAPEVLPPRVPDSERPSAKATRPPGVNAGRWKRMFETYGRLLDLDAILDDYHRDHPRETEIVTLATTHRGRAIKAMLIADDPSRARGRPAMLLNGAHHGNEPLSGLIALDAIDTLLSNRADPKIRRYLSELAIWVVPVVNPDGIGKFFQDLQAGRKNGRETHKPGDRSPLKARGVDLNRNYPFRWGATREVGSSKDPNRHSFRGPAPMSEPETKGMVDLSDREHFVGSISYHIGTVTLLAPYTIEGVPIPQPNEAWIVGEDIVRRMPKIHKRPVLVRKNIYTVDGTDQDYHRFAHGTAAFLLEAAAKNWDAVALAKEAIELVRPSWTGLFDRYLDGPSVEGHVRDEAGHAVSAKVEIAEVVTRAGEDWRSRCSDGFFGRYLPRFGAFTVRVSPPGGGAVIEKKVEVSAGKGRASVDIVVPASGDRECKEGPR